MKNKKIKKNSFTVEEVRDAAQAMQVFGGSFMKALGLALEKADKENTEKIVSSWEDDLVKYINMSKIEKKWRLM